MCRKAYSNNGPSRISSDAQFPSKLHDMLSYVERENLEEAICWVNNGRAFMINDPNKLVNILPLFFGQTKYRSFRRQLNMWHFERVLHGPHRDAFEHPYFVRGRKSLCQHRSRNSFKVAAPKKLQAGIYEMIANYKASKTICASTTTSTSDHAPPPKRPAEQKASEKITSEERHETKSLISVPFQPDEGFKDGDIVAFEGRQFHFLDMGKFNVQVEI